MNTVVYYPHFSPTDSWLRVASLCWDKVYRLLPHEAPADPPVVADLDARLGGVLEGISWSEIAERPIVKQRFKEWIAGREDDLQRWHRSPATNHEDKALMTVGLLASKFPAGELVEYLTDRGLASARRRTGYVEIPAWEEASWAWRHSESAFPYVEPPPEGSDHYEYEQLMDLARRRRFAGDSEGAEDADAQAHGIRRRNLITVSNDEEIVELPQDIALHYVSLCANEAATSEKRDLVGANEAFADSIFHRYRLTGEVAMALVEAVLPTNLADLEPERIHELRIELGTSRLLYHRDVEALAGEFANITSEGELDLLKNRLVDLAHERMAHTRRTYASARLEFAAQGLGVSITPSAAAAWLAHTLEIGLFEPAAVAGAVGLFGAKLLLDWSEARHRHQEAPWSYLLELRAAL